MLALPLPALLGLGFLLTEAAVSLALRARHPADTRRDDGTLRAIWRASALAPLALVVLGRATPGLQFDYPAAVLGAGVTLFAAGLALRWGAIATLGRLFTVQVAIRARHTLVRRGPYAWMRHPSYTGLLLAFAGLAVTFEHALALPVLLVPVTRAVLRRVRTEERALADAFGPAWGEYARATPRLVPGLY